MQENWMVSKLTKVNKREVKMTEVFKYGLNTSTIATKAFNSTVIN